MKKLLLISALAFVCLLSNAQDGLKGVWFAGGALTLQDVEHEGLIGTGDVGKTYTVMPLIGTFVSPSVAVGGALGYTHSKQDDLKTDIFTIMPLVRKYWNVSGKLYFFGQAALPIDVRNAKVEEAKASAFGISVALSPGFDLIVNDWLTVEASFNLISAGYFTSKPKDGDSTNSWAINGNSIGSSSFGDLSVGVKFLF